VVYFDSYGQEPPESVVQRGGREVRFNDIAFQRLDDMNCGVWCCYVLRELHSGVSPDDLLYKDGFDLQPTARNKELLLQRMNAS
jgi:hypothetical protein